MDLTEYCITGEGNPSHVYHDVLIALDESRGINNGQPSLSSMETCGCRNWGAIQRHGAHRFPRQTH
jgi:hypothetical protein